MARLCDHHPSAQGSERRAKQKCCLWTSHLHSWLGHQPSGHFLWVEELCGPWILGAISACWQAHGTSQHERSRCVRGLEPKGVCAQHGLRMTSMLGQRARAMQQGHALAAKGRTAQANASSLLREQADLSTMLHAAFSAGTLALA
jgi:hypothetical protein